MIRDIVLRDAEHVRHVNYIACHMPYDIWIHGGNLMLDAKSLLGLYALAGQSVKVVVEDNLGEKRLDRLVQAMSLREAF